MDEREWLSCTDPLRMLQHLEANPIGRKPLLLTAACLRRVWRVLPDYSRAWAELVEEAAEGWVDPKGLDHTDEGVEMFLLHWLQSLHSTGICTSPPGELSAMLWHSSQPSWRAERKALVALVRDMFGNPFRPIALDTAWGTRAVLALAQAAYENRILPAGTLEPDRLAVLAAVLEEAGCDQAELLGHLRAAGPHVRGCHVVDLILSKDR